MNPDVIDKFLDMWAGDLPGDLADHLLCCEVKALADLIREFDRQDLADDWLHAHALSDEDCDEHYIST